MPCRVCWQCKQDRVKDWVGRCIAESKTSVCSHLVTLTYGDVHVSVGDKSQPLEAARLTWYDVQLWLKRLRKAGYPLRFFAAGEYGKLKGRAHWHVLVFWQKRVPPGIVLDKRMVHKEGNQNIWPHGFSFWETLTVGRIQYACKYILKDLDYEPTNDGKRFGLSVIPPLGDAYFKLEAKRYAEAGITPRDLLYGFADAKDRNGRAIEFWLRGSSQYNFLDAFAEYWRVLYGKEDWPWSQLMDDFVDERARRMRRRLGIPDLSETELGRRMALEKAERKGRWLKEVRGEGEILTNKSSTPYRLRKDGHPI